MVNLRKWGLALAIAIVLNLFINYGISVFYKAPQYGDFCNENRYPQPFAKVAAPNCTAIIPSQQLQQNCTAGKGYIGFTYDSNGCALDAYCETCQARFDAVSQKRSSNVFVVLVVVGVAALAAGLIIGAEAVSAGLLLGGIICLIVAAVRTWGQLQDVLKFLLLGVVLAALIWLGYKKGSEFLPKRK